MTRLWMGGLFSLFLVIIMSNEIESQERPSDTDTPRNRAWNFTQTDKLKRALLLNYDKFTRPHQEGNVTQVTFNLVVRHVELDELKSLFSVHAWVRMMWTDPKLKWDPVKFGGVKTLHLADHEIWQPDIMLYNSAAGSIIDHYGNTYSIIDANGSVIWVPPAQFLSFCELNVRRWPFDTQMCSLKFGSWTHSGDQIDMVLGDRPPIEHELLVTNSEWSIVGTQATRNVKKYACCEENYMDITFNLTITRNSPIYNSIICTPIFVVTFCNWAIFLLPAHSGEKLLLNGSLITIVCLYLIYFSFRVPSLSSGAPLIVILYSKALILLFLSTIVAIVVINISRTKHTKVVPDPIRKLLRGILGDMLLLNNNIKKSTQTIPHCEELREHYVDTGSASILDECDSVVDAGDDDNRIIRKTTGLAELHNDWVLLATALDRLALTVFAVLYGLLFVVYYV